MIDIQKQAGQWFAGALRACYLLTQALIEEAPVVDPVRELVRPTTSRVKAVR
ncbi:MAG: hypothetical protein L3J88_03385 [Gammaproteobacteria bacterium]|nr:hypothetical protein [Gammaproteobacteria bacterium]MCF6362394.1 hypothetical protein [Gammaproteobacteria bacterium]